MMPFAGRRYSRHCRLRHYLYRSDWRSTSAVAEELQQILTQLERAIRPGQDF
jgi:hypothetical protein